ncbi:MAG: ATP-binding cassette domain-containing protein [Bdellovibrionales bacterium]|jgi:sulfonate transport system ATP-binding protein|nr:ATP-binding cassette domain-containing protein [Bdellovibrionales bacterium]
MNADVADEVLKVSRLSVEIEGRFVLSNVDVSLGRREFVAVLGRSGSGKSTFLKSLVGEAALINGAKVLGDIKGPGRFGYAPQRAPLLPWLSVRENLFLARPAHIEKKVFEARMGELLALADLVGIEGKKPTALSGGMRSRVSLVRSFLMDSSVLLMDEPFVGLDVVTKARLHALTLTMWERTQSAALFVTHDIDEALALASRVLILRRDGTGFCFDKKLPFAHSAAPSEFHGRLHERLHGSLHERLLEAPEIRLWHKNIRESLYES